MKKKIIRLIKPLISKIPLLAILYRNHRDNRLFRQEPQNTILGFKMIGNSDMQNGTFEPEETLIVKNILSRVTTFINIGANIGYYCCMALNESKQVLAFEPMPNNIRFLLKNIKANNWDNVEVYPLALSNHQGIIEIYGSGTGASLIKGWAGMPEKHITLVPCSTIDTVLGDRFNKKQCFILVDIEGAEYMMLQNANYLLNNTPKPVWLVEISIFEHQPKKATINPNLLSTFKLFFDKGYEAYTADKSCKPVSEEEISCIIDTGIDTLNTHNFIFVEKGKIYDFLVK